MNFLTQILEENSKFQEVLNELQNKISPIGISGLSDVEKIYMVDAILEKTERPICILTYNEIQAKKLYQDLKNLGQKVWYFPKREIAAYDYIAESKDLPYERIEVLNQIVLSEEYKKYQIRYTKICEQKKKMKDTRTPEKLNKELDRLNLLFQKDRITWEYYSAEYDRIEKELKELSAIHPEAEKDFTYLEELLRSDFKKIYEQLTPENRRTFWRSTIEEIHLNENYTVESVDFL